MSEECALGARFKMCEILLTPGKDFIIQVSQLRLVGIMGAVLACRDELERRLPQTRSVRCKIYCHIMTNS